MPNIYMAITVDKYELPIATADTPTELAKTLGIKVNSVNDGITKNLSGKINGIKFIKVKV